MKYLLFPLLALPALLLSLLPQLSPAPAPAPQEATVAITPPPAQAPLAVLELFTSQGCSSCPPADELLGELAREEGVFALSYHVDYWNYLGWEDPFSSPYYSARQTDYTERLGARTYTPQLVVNGTHEMVGSRRAQVAAAVAAALQNDRNAVPPSLLVRAAGTTLTAQYTLPATDLAGYRVSALLTQHQAVSAVKRGENRGKELRHRNVVRVLQHAPAASSGSFTLDLPTGLGLADVAVVLLVQNTQTHALVGAARASVSAR